MTPLPRRASALAAAALVSTAGLAACGSHHKASAPTSSAATTAPAPVAPGTTPTTVAGRRHAAVVAPLTGLPASRAVADQPAVVVKIDNVAAALPQTGPNQADVVYEEMVEGGLTRLAAVFQSQQPTTVGPVRSGRLTDEGIADDLGHPVLAYAGANALFQPILASQPVSDIDDNTNPNLFVRNYGQQAPHNLYTSIAGLAALDHPSGPPPALWRFRSGTASLTGKDVAPASSISIGFPAASAQWTWSAKAKLWLRDQNGSIDVDAKGVQLNASNVIVQFIPYVTTAYVTGEGGANGSPIPGGEFTGSGVAWYLSGGRIVKGLWTRSSLTAPTRYTDAAGKPIALSPGRTWVELPQVGTLPSVTP